MESSTAQIEAVLDSNSKKSSDEKKQPEGQSEQVEVVAEAPQAQDETTTNRHKSQDKLASGTFLSLSFCGSLESGQFSNFNDIYIKYSIRAGADWILAGGVDLGITQIARCKVDQNGERHFVWNQPIDISFQSYNFYGWPQIILSVYHFNLFGNDQILGYGGAHLPVCPDSLGHHSQVLIKIYSPQPTSFSKQLVSWITRVRPQLVDASLFARGDLRSSLQVQHVGQVELRLHLTSKDLTKNGYRTHA